MLILDYKRAQVEIGGQSSNGGDSDPDQVPSGGGETVGGFADGGM